MKKALEIHDHRVGTVWSGAHEEGRRYTNDLRAAGLDARLVSG